MQKTTGNHILAKKLPRDINNKILPTFRANKKQYTIRKPQEVLTGQRWKMYQKIRPILALNFASLNDFYNKLVEIRDTFGRMATEANPSLFVKGIAELNGVVDGAKKWFDPHRHDVGMMFCTLFVLRDGENCKTFSPELANEKIKDWEIEGYYAPDFLVLAANFCPQLNEFAAKSYESGVLD